MWTPDVYEGAPTPVTAFMSTAPKVAAVALLLRALETPFGQIVHQWSGLIVLISIASMLLGSLAAIGQKNIKRLMAYSSIGHIGYALVGLAVGTAEGVRGVMIYMVTYVFMSAGVFACIVAMRRRGRALEQISDLSGLARTDPGLALAMTVFMFSMAGIPPFSGFLRQAVCVPAGGAGWVLDAGGDRRADERRGGVLLPAGDQGDVFRRRGAGVRRAVDVDQLRGRGRGAGDGVVLRFSGTGCGGGAIGGPGVVWITGHGRAHAAGRRRREYQRRVRGA